MSSILCLYKYKNYNEEKDDRGNWWDEIPSYNSRQSRIHSAAEIGEKAYIVTYHRGHCYLVGRLIISEKVFNPTGHPYGEYSIRGRPRQSQCYRFGLIDVTEVLRQLEFKTGKRIGNSHRPLALHLQAVRELTEDDVTKLESAIARL